MKPIGSLHARFEAQAGQVWDDEAATQVTKMYM